MDDSAIINDHSVNKSISDRQVSRRLHLSRSMCFYQSMFLNHENFNETFFNFYADVPKTRWSLSRCNSDASTADDNLEDLLNTKWTVFKVSSFCKFSYAQSSLKKYSILLKESLKKDTVFIQENYLNIDVTFTIREDFRSCENDQYGVEVWVRTFEKGKNNRIKQKPITLYKGCFISWKNKLRDDRNIELKLPVLLCVYKNKNTVKAVHNALQEIFEVAIEQFIFHQDDFMCFFALLLTYLEEEANTSVTYVFNSSKRPKHEVIEFSLDLKPLINIWKMYNTNGENNVSVKNLIDFQINIEDYFYKMFSFDVEKLQLYSVVVPNQAFLQVDGFVRINSHKILDVLLRYLTNIIQLRYSRNII